MHATMCPTNFTILLFALFSTTYNAEASVYYTQPTPNHVQRASQVHKLAQLGIPSRTKFQFT